MPAKKKKGKKAPAAKSKQTDQSLIDKADDENIEAALNDSNSFAAAENSVMEAGSLVAGSTTAETKKERLAREKAEKLA